MKTPTILIPVLQDDYRVFAAAARLVRKERGADAPDAVALIQFQLKLRTPGGIAKDYLDCIGDHAARRRVKVRIRRATSETRPIRLGGRMQPLKSVRVPRDPSRN